MGLGGVVAVILPAVNYYAALYAGISMPIMISTIAKHRYGAVALSNEKRKGPIKASEPSDMMQWITPAPQPTKWQKLKELIQDHADRLFY